MILPKTLDECLDMDCEDCEHSTRPGVAILYGIVHGCALLDVLLEQYRESIKVDQAKGR